jgi:dihydrofolate reductase
MKFSLIAAADEKMGIGKNGRLPWGLKLPTDLAFFHKTTRGRGKNAVIMGRATWESVPENRRPLPDRLNIVLTHQNNSPLPSVVLRAASLPEALQKAEQKNAEEIFVIGGAKVFEEAIQHPDCQTIYLTEVSGDFQCDTFFPKIDPAQFKKISESAPHEENDIKFRFIKYQR